MDPATIAGIIVAVVQAAKEAQEKSDFSKWQDEVVDKLNQIIQKTDQILQELREFRIQIEVSLDDRFRTYYLAELTASISDLGNVLAGLPKGHKLNKDERTRIRNHADKLSNILKQSWAYGFASIPSALAGYSALIPAMKLAKIPKAEIDSTRKDLYSLVFAPSLDPLKLGSFAWSLGFFLNEASFLRNHLIEFLRPTTVGLLNPFGFPIQQQAAVVKYYGTPNLPDTIEVSEIELKNVGGSVMVTFETVQPRPVPVGGHARNLVDAESVRTGWLANYVADSKWLVEDERKASSLNKLMKQIRDLTTV
jgi:hypothetical protein